MQYTALVYGNATQRRTHEREHNANVPQFEKRWKHVRIIVHGWCYDLQYSSW